MTKTEAKDILINRLDFRVSGANPDSGRYFEGEHPIVLLENIRECQPSIGISDGDFTTYLTTLKTDVIYGVLSDVFDKDEIEDSILTYYPALFDNVISMKMTIKVIDLIIAATRSNRTTNISDDTVKMIYFDVNGANGYLSRYQIELKRVKNKTGNQPKLRSITNG